MRDARSSARARRGVPRRAARLDRSAARCSPSRRLRMPADVEERIARCFRDDAGRAVAKLAQPVGDLTLAEDAVAEAYVSALERWPRDGFPARPSAWILITARRRAIDRLRRERTGREKAARLAALEAVAPPPDDESAMSVTDDRLELIFACCHPALGVDARVALTLNALGGLTTAEVADAFLVPLATMAQRLVRVKRKIPRCGDSVRRAAARTAGRTARRRVLGDLLDLQRGLRRHVGRAPDPHRVVRRGDSPRRACSIRSCRKNPK